MIRAIILAGGSGRRIGASIPKQFIEINGKPILIHTLEKFESHPLVDVIDVVCIEGWEDKLREFAKSHKINKLRTITTGGRTALSSIRKGIECTKNEDNDIIVIHDGVRPLVDEKSITNVIEDCRVYGGAISSIPLIEHVFYVGESRTDLHYIPRENAFRTVTPQAYVYSKLRQAFDLSDKTGIGADAAFIGLMMMDLGEKVCLSEGSDQNIKITDPKDIQYFKSLL